MTSGTDSNAEETAVASELGRVLISRQPNADLNVPPNDRYWAQSGHGAASMAAMGDPSHSLIVVPSEVYTNVPSVKYQ
jgi:hypothetical protein